MNCGGGSSYYDDKEEYDDSYTPSDDPMPEELSQEAWKLYMDFEDELALSKINLALEKSDRYFEYWNKKAIILESLKRYAESEECYDRSLELSAEKVVFENKARMLYDWASQLLEEDKLDEAKQVIKRAIDSIPRDSEENIRKYFDLRNSINFRISHEKTY